MIEKRKSLTLRQESTRYKHIESHPQSLSSHTEDRGVGLIDRW